MTSAPLWLTGAGLAFVLGLLVLIAWLARHVTPRLRRPSAAAGRIEILSRAGLAPKQGVATLRVDGRTALVSFGDGGVRLLMELEGAESGEGAAEPTEEATAPVGVGAGARRGRSKRLAALKALSLGLALLLVAPGFARAQAHAPTKPHVTAPATPQVAGARTPSVPNGLPDMHLSIGGKGAHGLQLSGPVGMVLFIGLLTLLPMLLLLMTSFTRILVVLHLLKQALGTQTAPPAQLLAAMALILTGFVMAPTLKKANDQALSPWIKGDIDTGTMMSKAEVPFRAFMLHTVREQDLERFVEMSHGPRPTSVDEIPLVTIAAAFVTSELTRAFQIGFALFLPFMIIDLVVASVLMSMGMFMLPPVMVSLPFKLLLFVLVGGWSLVLGSLVQSFH